VKVGQIIKINKSGLPQFAPAIRARIEGEIGLVVQEKYELSHKLDQDKLPERVRIYPSLVRFQSLQDLNFLDMGAIMVFADQAEVLS